MKVGDYVRTKKGELGKIMYINKDNTVITTDYIINPSIAKCVHVNHIKISSSSIRDLIEINDILSFKDNSIARIQEINDKYYLLKDYGGEQYYEKDEWVFDNLKSIVTKEQFENMEYKVGD